MCLYNFYIIENLRDDLRYIGVTKNDLSIRKATHRYNHQKEPKKFNYLLYQKMRQFGFENFIFDLIEIKYFETKNDALKYEKQLIKEYSANMNIHIN